MITFTVFGVPIPQGSMRAFMPKGGRYPIVTADNAKTKPWRHSIIAAAQEALGGRGPIDGDTAVEVEVMFFMPRPSSAPRRVTEPVKTRGSDIDKLERALLDALSAAGVFRDDAQVISVVKRKAFAGGHRDPLGQTGIPRAVVRVREALPVEGRVTHPLLEAR